MSTNTFRAAVVRTPSGPDSIEILDLAARAPGRGEARIAVAAASINPVDLAVAGGVFHRRGVISPGRQAGLGWDFAGTVVESGPGTGVEPGTRVAGVVTGFDREIGAYADEVVIAASEFAVVPDALDLVAASTIPINGLAAVQMLDLLGAPAPGSNRLLVTGAAGVLGGNLLALAGERGWQVTGLARADDEAFVRGLGAAFTTAPDHRWDAVADGAAMQSRGLALVRDGGRFVGVQPGTDPQPERGISVHTVVSHADGRLGDLLERAAASALPVRVHATVPLDRVADGQKEAAKPGVRGRVVLLP